MPRVASVLRRHAVDVLWTFAGSTSLDWDCGDSVQCVLNNYLSFYSSGTSGIPLQHAVMAGTAGAHTCMMPFVCHAHLHDAHFQARTPAWSHVSPAAQLCNQSSSASYAARVFD